MPMQAIFLLSIAALGFISVSGELRRPIAENTSHKTCTIN
jgi:hypothetical protein